MWHDFFANLSMKLFGTLEWGGVSIGFWAAMLVCVILVVVMNLVFWLVKPKSAQEGTQEKGERRRRNGKTRK